MSLVVDSISVCNNISPPCDLIGTAATIDSGDDTIQLRDVVQVVVVVLVVVVVAEVEDVCWVLLFFLR